MPSDLSTLDLATLNAAESAIVAILRSKCCQWEQDSADAAADGRLSNAVMVQNWAFAADLLASKVSGEFAALFGRALDAQLNWSTTSRTRVLRVGAIGSPRPSSSSSTTALLPGWNPFSQRGCCRST